jgi:acetyltransferase-like isoleucine patch superfamily enzyme
VLKRAKIGSNCNVNCHVFIENDVVIGDNVTVKSGNYLWDGLTVEDNVFIGPNVTFTNDKLPRSKQYPISFQRTVIQKNASIGAGAILLGGVVIGEFAMVGAGSLVTKNIPPRALVYGNPASIKGWLNKDGTKMVSDGIYYLDADGQKWEVIDNKIMLV